MDYHLKRHWATNIKEGRKARRLSQQELGEQCGVDQSTVSRWERCMSLPTEDNKVAIAAAFDVDDPRHIFPLRMPARTPAAPAAAAPAPEPVGT